MQETRHETEDLFQELLAAYPALLAGEQVNQLSPRRWLLVDREMEIPGEEGGGRRWSLDHLFLDQDGVPTLVEVKRSTDTRLRREVVGQMLDYASNAVAYWPVESIQARFESMCAQEGALVSDKLADAFGPDVDESAFWNNVKTNLQAGRIRMIFVADMIPPELLRIVEFLNTQMDPAEVLALELRQYIGEGHKTLVPRVLGQRAIVKPPSESKPRQWDQESFMTDLRARCGDKHADAAQAILNWASDRGLCVWWGRGRYDGSFFPEIILGPEKWLTFSVWTYGTVEVQFKYMKSPFHVEDRRRELLYRLQSATAITLDEKRLDKRPTFPLAGLIQPEQLQGFLATFDWFVEEVRKGWA